MLLGTAWTTSAMVAASFRHGMATSNAGAPAWVNCRSFMRTTPWSVEVSSFTKSKLPAAGDGTDAGERQPEPRVGQTAADLLAWAYHRTYDLPVVISRCSNNYGPRQHPEKFIPTVILNAIQDKPVPIYGDGLYVRDWIHVLDHCYAVDVIMHKGQPIRAR